MNRRTKNEKLKGCLTATSDIEAVKGWSGCATLNF